MGFMWTWACTAVGVFFAILWVDGITPTTTGAIDVLAICTVAGLLNSILGPLFKLFTFPLAFLTFGLWLLFANMIIFWLCGTIGREMGFGFTVDGVWSTLWGALIVTFVGWVLNILFARRR